MKKTFICLILFSLLVQGFSQNSNNAYFNTSDANSSKAHRGFQKRYSDYSESQEDPSLSKSGAVSSKSRVNWIEKEFISDINLDMKKAHLQMPAGKTAATALITQRLPFLLKTPVLSIFVDSTYYLGDYVESEDISLDQISRIVESSKRSPALFSSDGKSLGTTNTIKLDSLSRELVKHKYPYMVEPPLDTVSTRAYSGIIIDCRGTLPVHGEYSKSEVYPCFFPKVWDEEMNLIFEKNMVNREVAMDNGIVYYHYSDDFTLFEDKVGTDPLYIKAFKVYGRNRCDPVIRKNDAWKIIALEENKKLFQEGKVVVLLDKDNLICDVKVPQKDSLYYASFKNVKKYMYENKVPDIEVKESLQGILFSVDLKFVPDSPELLSEELPRIRKIAQMLVEIVQDNSFTILVEGHTADLGKPVGQMNLSIERTRTVMQALVTEGVPENLFTYKGYGATRPVASNLTEEGRAQNRRVDITARPRATYIQRDWN
ncbi:MAG: OmpA family protein [Treponema sp.]|nr:OmpA family protein [Treponema sp.]